MQPLIERLVTRPEHAAGKHDLYLEPRQVKPADQRVGHRGKLVGEPIDDAACNLVTGPGLLEDDRRHAADARLGNASEVEGSGQRRRRPDAEEVRHGPFEARPGAAAVSATNGGLERGHRDPAAAAPIDRYVADPGKARLATIRCDGGGGGIAMAALQA